MKATIGLSILLFLLIGACNSDTTPEEIAPPNIILIMADDLGWGDVGFNGNDTILTPHLDEMAGNGIQFSRFYSAAPVCSPTRGSCLTGRHPYRYGIFNANTGHLKTEEINMAEILKEQGYTTGHFGKWHLGTLTKEVVDANRGGRPQHDEHYAPPWEQGFDVCFSTESKVPTWNPLQTPEKAAGGVGNQGLGNPYGTRYWTGPGETASENMEGDNSRVIMDRAIPFIRQAQEKRQPFLAVIWFHTPHAPVVAGKDYRDLYPDIPEEKQHYYGCISALDEQIGRLRKELKTLGIHENTLTFFTSDNGPENSINRPRSLGITLGLSERKRSLKEGGVRVPGLMEYPAMVQSRKTDVPFSTSDYLPTVLDLLDISMPDQRPLDGISILPFLGDSERIRNNPIPFRSGKQLALIDDQYKIYSKDDGETFALYNLENDRSESKDLAQEIPEKLASLQTQLAQWITSQEKSLQGADYPKKNSK